MENIGTKRLFPSHFIQVLEKDDLVVLVHKLHPEPVYLLAAKWRDIVESLPDRFLPNQEIISELILRRLLIDNGDIDKEEITAAREKAIHMLNRPTILYLMMSQGCNFSCNYCPIPALAEKYSKRLLSLEDAVAGIKLWQKHISEYPPDDNPYFLIFYGGEPLLNREVLEQLLPYITDEQMVGRLPDKLELMLCTNGSLIDEDLSKLLARYRVTVAVGIDGPQEHNDRIRIANDGSPTFVGIEYIIKQLVKDGIRVVASVTITPANVGHLSEYPKLLQDMGVAKFGFNLMKGKALLSALHGKSIENYCQKAARGILFGLKDITENGECYEYQLEKKMMVLQNVLPFPIDCTCYGSQLVIQPDGQISNCPFLRCDQGHVKLLPETFRIGSTETVKDWRKRLPLLNNSLLVSGDNGLLSGGGCAWSSYELYGDIAAVDRSNDIFSKEVLYGLIWKLCSEERANELRQGRTTHWSYRRIGYL